MSFLQKVFHKKPKSTPPTLSEALQKLGETEEMLIKKQEYLESKIAKEVGNAKKNATKNKQAAIQSLKRKKCLEKQLVKLDGALTTVEMQKEALESASVNSNVISSMQVGHGAIAAANKNMTPETVADMINDLAELAEDQEKITGAICEHQSNEDDLDMDELERELAELELGAVDEKQSVPSDKDKLDKELEELAAWDGSEKQPIAARLPAVPAEAISSKTRSKASVVPTQDVATSNTRKKEKATALALAS